MRPGAVLVSPLLERSLEQGQRSGSVPGAQDDKPRLGGVPVDLVGLTAER